MKKTALIFVLTYYGVTLQAQYIHTLRADSVKITACDSAELILENHTQHIPGFLFNTGNGRTEFRRMLSQLNDSLYVLGGDTIDLEYGSRKAAPGLTANNGAQRIADTFQFGNDLSNAYNGPANQIRPTIYNQNGQFFNWVTQNNSILTFSKEQYTSNPVENNPLKDKYIARFAAVNQGAILFQTSLSNVFSAPLQWINFKNNNANAVRAPFFNDQLAAQISTGVRQGADGKIYHNFKFVLGSDSVHTNTTILALQPSFTATSGGPIKIPSAVVKRLVVEAQTGTGTVDNFSPLTYNNPYSRLVVDAADHPVVFGDLPQSDIEGRFLIIDNSDKVWRGDTTSDFSGGMNSTVAAVPVSKIVTDQRSSSITPSDATGLSFNVSAGQYHKFKFMVVYRSSDVSTGLRLSIKSPASKIFAAEVNMPQISKGQNSQFRGIISSTKAVVSQGVKSANTDYIAIVEGIILPSSGGTVQLGFASTVNGKQVSVRKGSMVEVRSY